MSSRMRPVLDFVLKYKYVIIAVIGGIILLLLPTGSREKEKASPPTDTEQETVATDDNEFEHRLEELLSTTKGAGRVRVMLSLESSVQTELAEDVTRDTRSSGETRDDSFDRKITTIQTSDGQTPIVVRTIYPTYRGAVVVCDGAENAEVRLSIVEAVSSATGIASDKIVVIKMKE